jgi:hypothetical protein
MGELKTDVGLAGPSPATIYYNHSQQQGYCGCPTCAQYRRDQEMRNMAKQLESIVTDKAELTRLRLIEQAARDLVVGYDKVDGVGDEIDLLSEVESKLEALRSSLGEKVGEGK